MSNRNETDSTRDEANIGAHTRYDLVPKPDATSLQLDRRRNHPDVVATTYHVNSQGVVHLPFAPLSSASFAQYPVAPNRAQPNRSAP